MRPNFCGSKFRSNFLSSEKKLSNFFKLPMAKGLLFVQLGEQKINNTKLIFINWGKKVLEMGKIPQKCIILLKDLEKLTCNSESDCVSASPLIAWMSSAVDWARIRACRTISPESKLAMSSPLATKICSMMSGILSVWPSLTWLRRSLRALKQKLLREFYKNFEFFLSN